MFMQLRAQCDAASVFVKTTTDSHLSRPPGVFSYRHGRLINGKKMQQANIWVSWTPGVVRNRHAGHVGTLVPTLRQPSRKRR